ncbi:MAG TPA: hypothetical protein VN782_15340 [Usitatibacter sp.]|nr:hypothetical protein [Usitatibacter sp.]
MSSELSLFAFAELSKELSGVGQAALLLLADGADLSFFGTMVDRR